VRPVRHEHDGGYEGSYQLATQWIRVPAGLNLVFKLGLEKYWGRCYDGDDTALRERTETQTYFVPVRDAVG
jgi:hypothetical protein